MSHVSHMYECVMSQMGQGRLSAEVVSVNGVASTNATVSGKAGSWVLLAQGEYMLKDTVAEAATLTPHMQSFKVCACVCRVRGSC